MERRRRSRPRSCPPPGPPALPSWADQSPRRAHWLAASRPGSGWRPPGPRTCRRRRPRLILSRPHCQGVPPSCARASSYCCPCPEPLMTCSWPAVPAVRGWCLKRPPPARGSEQRLIQRLLRTAVAGVRSPPAPARRPMPRNRLGPRRYPAAVAAARVATATVAGAAAEAAAPLRSLGRAAATRCVRRRRGTPWACTTRRLRCRAEPAPPLGCP